MIRSLRTGVSGLLSNQVRMDVIGNNVSNVNTLAYKRGRAAFNEVLGQQLLGVGRMSGGSGVNPSYVGLGVTVGSIDQNWTQGALENTNRATDLALNGDGFFIAKSNLGQVLTRAGNFSFNREGHFVTSTGLSVQGWGFDDSGNVVTGVLKDIEIDPGMTTPPSRTENLTVSSNFSADAATGAKQTISSPVYDKSGKAHNLLIEFTKIKSLGETVAPAADEVSQWQAVVTDEDGNQLLDGAGNPQTYDIYFDASGSLVQQDGSALAADAEMTFTWDLDADGTAPTESFDINFGGVSRTGVTSHAGSSTVSVTEQDGYGAGTLIGYAINQEGVLELNFSNGQQKKAFQLAIGQVTNPHGLEQLGENFYSLTTASGELQVRQAGRESRAVVVSGALEMSNVDLASEFTEMIVSQRGFQASARVITSSDELLQETVQLKR